MFRKKPNYPCAMNDKLPALQGVTSGELIAQHLNAMHSARKAFISCESSEKLRRALRHKTCDIMKIIYKSGDTVYCCKKDCSYWKGPGKVIGMENKQVFVRHGGTYWRVHPLMII